MDRWLINAPRWLLLAALVFAPWACGSTGVEASQFLAWMLSGAFVLWAVVGGLRRTWPAVPRVAAALAALLGILGWFMALNARYDYEVLSHHFSARAQWFPGAAGSLHRELSMISAFQTMAMLAAFIMTCDLVRYSQWRKRLLLTAALTGTSIALLGLVQKCTGATSIFWGAENMGQTFFATYRYHANAGAFLNLTWPLVAGFLTLSFFTMAPGWQKAVWSAAFVVCLAGVFVNTSRASSALGVLLLMAGSGWGAWQVLRGRFPGLTPSMALVTGLILIGLVGSVAALAGLDSSVHRWSRFGLEVSDQNPRLLASEVCMDMVPQAGWFGFGPGTFPTAFPYFTERFGNHLRGVWLNAHQDYLQTLIEWGFVGAVIWGLLVFGGVGYSVQRAFRHRAALAIPARITHVGILLSVAGVLLHALVDFPLQIASIQLYLAVLLGLLWGSRNWLWPSTRASSFPAPARSHRPHHRRSRRPRADSPALSP